MRMNLTAACVCGMLCATMARADWPQFQGPARQGVAQGESKLLRAWPEGGPKVLWTVTLGEGYGGPAIDGGQVFLLDRRNDQTDVLRVFDLASGKELWGYSYDAPGKLDYNGSRAVPAVDAQRVYTVGPFGHMHAIDRRTHNVVWKVNLLEDFGGQKPKWGVSQSPLLYQNAVIVAPQTPTAGVVALSKDTGKVLWKSEGTNRAGYASPTVAAVNGRDHILMVTPKGVTGLDPQTGKTLWSYAGFQCGIPIAAPTPLGDDRFFVTGGYNAGSAIFQVKDAGGSYTVTELARNKSVGSQIHPGIVVDDHIFAGGNTNDKNDGLVCFDAKAQVVWKTGKQPHFERGGYLLADGLLFIVEGKIGDLVLVEPRAEGYKELARAPKMLGGGNIWAPPAIAQGRLLIRDQKQLKCVEVGPLK